MWFSTKLCLCLLVDGILKCNILITKLWTIHLHLGMCEFLNFASQNNFVAKRSMFSFLHFFFRVIFKFSKYYLIGHINFSSTQIKCEIIWYLQD